MSMLKVLLFAFALGGALAYGARDAGADEGQAVASSDSMDFVQQ